MRIKLLLAVLLMIVILYGCNKEKVQNVPADASTEQQPVNTIISLLALLILLRFIVFAEARINEQHCTLGDYSKTKRLLLRSLYDIIISN